MLYPVISIIKPAIRIRNILFNGRLFRPEFTSRTISITPWWQAAVLKGKRKRFIINAGEELEYPKRIPIAGDAKKWEWHDPDLNVKVIPTAQAIFAEEYLKSPQYFRKLYAQYGKASGINPCLLWPSKVELDELKEDAELEEPLEDILEKKRCELRAIEEKAQNTQEQIAKNKPKIAATLMKLHKQKRLDKERAESVREKRRLLLQKAEQMYGYRVNPDSPKFQILLTLLRKEDKKLKKKPLIREKAITQKDITNTNP